MDQTSAILKTAKRGAILQEGIQLVIVGEPNVGKSSLLNALTDKDTAIVTDIAGTTRDILREYIQIEGVPIHIVDTAGLRETDDVIEQMGVERAKAAVQIADHALLVCDDTHHQIHSHIDFNQSLEALKQTLPANLPYTVVHNKIDLSNRKPSIDVKEGQAHIGVSAKQRQGLDLLKQHLLKSMGYAQGEETSLTARARHVDALMRAQQSLLKGSKQLLEGGEGELLAEDLKVAQGALSEITGEFSSDDLLGEIFSSFCIGK